MKTANDFSKLAALSTLGEGQGTGGVNDETAAARLLWMRDVVAPRLRRCLGYYRNPMTELTRYLPCALGASLAVKPYRQFQEMGLPMRITGFRHNAAGTPTAQGSMDVQRKEVVIENDIGWRVNTLVDFVAGQMPAVVSTARDAGLREKLTALVNDLLAHAGGVELLQELVLQGAIGGSAWVRIDPTEELLGRVSGEAADPGAGGTQGDSESDAGVDIARWVRVRVIETARVCPLAPAGEEGEAGRVAVLREDPMRAEAGAAKSGLLQRVSRFFRGDIPPTAEVPLTFDAFGSVRWQRYVSGELAEEGTHGLGCVPFVRYENQRDPASPAGGVDVGLSEVEPLIALQDELNTRLSDRAYRVTMTSFRMYLGKGIEDFTTRAVAPGQMWATDNIDATIESFGGDASTPSEDAHIGEIRDALDKVSGVSPVAAGLLRGKLGNLTSAIALRITLIALLARTQRKRAGVAAVLSELVRKVLAILDRAGVLQTSAEDRGIDINWPSPLPENEMDRLAEAQAKVGLGIPKLVVLGELGYSEIAES